MDSPGTWEILPKRLGKFGLQLHPEKTRLVDFRPWRSAREQGAMLPTTFNFLGFTHVWGKSRKGNAVVRQLTAKDRLARSLKAVNQRCKRMRHWPIRDQHQRLCRMLKGRYAYFGITGPAVLGLEDQASLAGSVAWELADVQPWDNATHERSRPTQDDSGCH